MNDSFGVGDDDFFGMGDVDDNDALAMLNDMAPSPAVKVKKSHSRYEQKVPLAKQIILNARLKEQQRQKVLLDHAKKASGVTDDAAGVGTPPQQRGPSPLIRLAPNNLIDLPGFGDAEPAAVQNSKAAELTVEDDEDEDDEIFFGAVSAKECAKRVETIKAQKATKMSASELQRKHQESAKQYRATIKAAISGEESGSAIADATNTLLLAEPTKSILKKANEDDDDEVFFGAVSTTEVKKTLQIIKTEKTLPSTITTAAAAATTAEPPAAIRSVVFQKAAPVSVSVTAAPAPAPPASFEQPAAPATSKAAEEAKPAKRPSAIPGPRRSGLPKPKAFSSRLAKPSQKLSSFSSPAKAPVANLKPMKSSSLAADPAPLISLTLEVKEAQVPAAAPSGAVDVGQRETLISFSPMAVKAAAPLISLSPVVTSIPPLISLSPIVTAAAPEPAHDLSPLISLSPVKAPASTPASAINPSLFTALQKAKKPKKLPTVKGGKAVSSTAVKAPSCAVLKPKNSNAAAVDKSLFKASDEELKALEDAIVDPSDRENFKIATLTDATQYKVVRPRTVSESLSPVGPRFSPSTAKKPFGAATVANADVVAPLKPASIWSPIKKTASFDEIQSQYY